MRFMPESLLMLCAPITGLAALCVPVAGVVVLCAGLPGLTASASAETRLRSRLQPEVTTDQTPVGFRVKSQPLPAFQPISLDVGKFAFTAPGKAAPAREQTVERSFSFTPSRSVKGLSIGVTTRAVAPADRLAIPGSSPDGSRSMANSVDLAVNYKGFQIVGGMSRSDTGIGGLASDAVDVGLGYANGKIRTDITATAEHEERMFLGNPGNRDPRYGLEANGLFALSPSVSVGGTLRYRLAPSIPTPLDPNRDDRAVILGGAVAF